MTHSDSHGTSAGVPTGIVWRKSSRSNGEGGACVEIADWRKSSYSNGQGGACVEAANGDGRHLARDSKNPTGPVLSFGCSAWRTFLTDVKTGRHDLP